MPSVRKMPAGKEQFGIIVPTEVHTQAKHLAADLNLRISDVYAEGVKALLASQNGDKAHPAPEQLRLAKKITADVPREDWKAYEAVAKFLTKNKDAVKLAMFKLLVGWE